MNKISAIILAITAFLVTMPSPAAETLGWTGGNGTWDVNNIGNSTIWKNTNGVNAYYVNPDPVVFDNEVGSGGTVTLNTTVSPASVTVSNTTAYTISGSGGIAGSTGLTKSGTGQLTLATSNSFTGGLTFSNATLIVGAAGALGSGPVTGTSSATLTFNTPGDATFTNAMNLAVPDHNAFSNASATATITLNGNLTVAGASYDTFTGTGVGNGGFVLGGSNVFAVSRFCVKNTSVTLANSYAANSPNFQRVALGESGGSASAVYLADGITMPWKILDSVNNDINNCAFTVGMKTAGSSTYSGTGSSGAAVDLHYRGTGGSGTAWNFEAGAGATCTFSGAIVNTGSNVQTPLTKTGAGTVMFSGVNTYDGDTTIANGVLQAVTGGSSSNSAVTVAATSGNPATLGVAITDQNKSWTCSSLAVNNAGTSSGLSFDFGSVTPSASLAPLRVLGAATFTTTPVMSVNLNAAVATNTPYPLMTWGSGGASAPTAVTVPAGYTAHLTVSGSTLYVVFDSASGGGVNPNIIPSLAFTNVYDYGFMWWSNGPASSLYGIKTSRYAMLFNWAALTPTALFPVTNPRPEAEVLTESAAASFPPMPWVAFSCLVITNGITNTVTASSSISGDVQLVENGKFFQRRWQKVKAGGFLVTTNVSGLEVASWPDRISFVLRIVPSNAVPSGTLQMTLGLTNRFNALLTSGAGQALVAPDGSGFVFLKSVGSSSISVNPANAMVTVTTTMSSWQTNQEGSVGLIIYPTTNAAAVLAGAVATETAPLPVSATQTLPATGTLSSSYDPDRGWYDVVIPGKGTAGNNGILRAKIAVTNSTASPRVVRLNFDGVPFYIVGISAVLRDLDQNPIGIPVQLSKDWDTPATYPGFHGQWFHGLTMLTVPANTSVSFELAMVGQNWGGMPAASHAQLCIIGYSEGSKKNQQWDEAALGSFGESFTYDVEHGLTDNDGADTRPLMLLTTNGLTGQWTGNFGGAQFLRYYDLNSQQRPHSRMRTQYARYSPNLARAVFAGQTDDGKMTLSYSTGVTRSDDCIRGLHELQVDVVSNVSFSRLVFFQQAADTYATRNGNILAYGNATNLLPARLWAATFGLNANFGTPVALTGPMPWGATLNTPLTDYAPASRGFVIRSWESRINGVTNVPPYIVERSVTTGGGASLLDIVPPPGVTSLQAGDYVHAVIERFYVAQNPGDYYGPDQNMARAVTNYGNTYNMVLREAIGNNLAVNVQAGTLAQVYPSVEIGVSNDFAQFSMTGGLNYVPVTFTGVSTYRNPAVEEQVGTNWVAVNQAVNGDDFWQADYNSANQAWDITYNLKMGSTNYQDIPALLTNAVTRTFRFSNPNAVIPIIPTAPIIFTNAVWLASGGGGAGGAGFQFSGTGPAGQPWRLFTATNLTLPWAQWTLETSNIFSGSGQFNYTSPVPANAGQQFYRLISP